MRSTIIKKWLIGAILFLCIPSARGCIYNVRDVGFVDMGSPPYRLYCFIRDDTPEEHVSTFNKISRALFLDSNIKVEIINIDRNRDHKAVDYVRFWEIKSFPGVVLISPAGRSMNLRIHNTGKSFKESVWSSLEDVVFSPRREDILEHIVKAYGVVLLIEGKNAQQNRRAYKIVTDANKKISRGMGQLPKRIEEPPVLIVIPQESMSREKILLWSLGLTEKETVEPTVAVFYGRGRRIGPLLRGNQITERKLFTILSVIGLSCECGLDRKWLLGSLMPLRWGNKLQSAVVKHLGFDAENPMVKREMSSIMALGSSNPALDGEALESIQEIFGEYSEEVLTYERSPAKARVSPAQFQKLVSPTDSDSESNRNMTFIIWMISAIIFLILTISLLILLRSRKKKSL